LGILTIGGLIAVVLTFLALGPSALLAVAAFAIFIITLFAYTIAAIPLLPALGAAATAAALPANPFEGFMGGLITGLTAGVNFSIWALLPLGPAGFVIGIVVGVICFLSAFAALSRNAVYQTVLGWANWAMPYSYLATSVGILLFLINLPFALAALGLGAVRFDVLTATIETTGGIVGITGFVGGFNLGNYTFLSPGGAGLGFQTPFGVSGISAHETGHTLTVGSFGGIFHWVNAIDENVPPLRRLTAAYGETIAESHLPRPLPRRHVRIWS